MAATTRLTLLAMMLLSASAADGQRRSPRPARPARPAADAGVAAAAPPANAAPELISVSVAEADTHLRQMRVYLFTPPAGATAYGLASLGDGARVWALLPSCRPPNPDDPRDPCPIDRVVFEAEGGGSVHAMDPRGLAPGAESRRVQSFAVPSGIRRVHIKVMGLQARVRYEATVDVERLVDLVAPQGSATTDGFAFELARYPAR